MACYIPMVANLFERHNLGKFRIFQAKFPRNIPTYIHYIIPPILLSHYWFSVHKISHNRVYPHDIPKILLAFDLPNLKIQPDEQPNQLPYQSHTFGVQ